MTKPTDISSLYEELIYLDEVAGELDPETNAKVEAQRQLLVAKIKEMESNTSDWLDIYLQSGTIET